VRKIITDVEQGSPEWLQMRLGVITASKFKDVISSGRGSAPSKTRQSYMYQLAAETVTGQGQDFYSNEFMVWGTETEPEARTVYELKSGNKVNEVAFVKLDNLNVGVSPDGLIGEDGGIEIKCPKTSTQIETFLSGKMPSYHKAQVQGCMWVTGREWWDFVSYDPRIDGEASYFCQRIERDENYITDLSKKCVEFQNELEEIINKLKG